MRSASVFIMVALIGVAPMMAQHAPSPGAGNGEKPAAEPTGVRQNVGPNVVESLGAAKDLAVFTGLLRHAGLSEAVRAGEYTIFAPTDAAFEKLPAGAIDTLRKAENRDALRSLLTTHMIPGRVTAERLRKDGAAPKTLKGCALKVDITGATIRVGSRSVTANVVRSDAACFNGVIHVVDAVVVPEGFKFGEAQTTEASRGVKSDSKSAKPTTTDPKQVEPPKADPKSSPASEPKTEPKSEPAKEPSETKPKPQAPSPVPDPKSNPQPPSPKK